jgi:hypothetical protein
VLLSLNDTKVIKTDGIESVPSVQKGLEDV